MFLAIQENNHIAYASDTEQNVINQMTEWYAAPYQIVETSEKYVLYRDIYITEEEAITQIKIDKHSQNDCLANKTLPQTFTIQVGTDKTPCQFIYNEKTERNLNSSALGFITKQYETKDWTDEQGITVQLTAEDVATILLTFNTFANGVWAKWGEYKQQIENAQTIKEINNINLDYTEFNNTQT